MSEQLMKMGFGAINDTDESLKGKDNFVKFGLNTGVINSIALVEEPEYVAVDIVFESEEKEIRRRIFDVNRVYDKKGNQLTDETDPAYIQKYNQAMMQNMAVIIHALKAVGVTQEQINAALAVPPTSFKEWALRVIGLLPAGYSTKIVDAFLEYQWNISEGQDRTYLELPKNMKGGRFLAPHVTPVGSWKEEREWGEGETGLRYVDQGGNVHPFVRSESYMSSNKANQQTESSKPYSVTPSTDAEKSTW